jgi:mannose-6-phosphate isomerase
MQPRKSGDDVDERVYPLTFTPVLRDYIWGGRRLETLYGRRLPPGIVAESWEISGHPTAPTMADNGYWAGRGLPEILAGLGGALVGPRAGWALERGRFPLLIKLLDAHEDLSVQVHPDDEYAAVHEGDLGKTEMWYVLHADPGTELILGVRPGTTREVFKDALAAGNLAPLLHNVRISAGDAVAVPTGTVHALLAGTVATEIQQNSDTTYRVYDWGRAGADGQPRPLHVEKALEVIDFEHPAPGIVVPQVLSKSGGVREAELVRNRYFVVEELNIDQGVTYRGACDGSTMEIWGCVRGEADLEWEGEPVHLPAIRYVLLPATLGAFRVTARQPSTCLRTYLPG